MIQAAVIRKLQPYKGGLAITPGNMLKLLQPY
jgi:hypothetical protein